jgi:hypothetical protein
MPSAGSVKRAFVFSVRKIAERSRSAGVRSHCAPTS